MDTLFKEDLFLVYFVEIIETKSSVQKKCGFYGLTTRYILWIPVVVLVEDWIGNSFFV